MKALPTPDKYQHELPPAELVQSRLVDGCRLDVDIGAVKQLLIYITNHPSPHFEARSLSDGRQIFEQWN